MKIFAMSEEQDTIIGLRFAGIEGRVIDENEDALAVLKKAAIDPEIGIILMTETLMQACAQTVEEIKLHQPKPLISVVPDRKGNGQIANSISKYVREAIGIRI